MTDQVSTRGEGRFRAAGLAVWAVALVVLAFAAWVVYEVVADDDSSSPIGMTIDDIVSDPASFYGERVAVTGTIRERFGSNAVTIGRDELLVVGADELTDAAGEGDLLLVVGEVRPLTSAGADDEAGADLDDELFAGLVERPAVFAENVVLEPGD